MSVFFEFSKLLCFQFSEFHISAMSGTVSEKHLLSFPGAVMYSLEPKKSTHLLTRQSQREGYQVKKSAPSRSSRWWQEGPSCFVLFRCACERKTHTIQTESEKLQMNYQNDRATQPPVQIPIITAAKCYCCYDVHRQYRRKSRNKTLAVSHLRWVVAMFWIQRCTFEQPSDEG